MSIKSREERQRAAVIGYCKNCGRSSETHGVVCEIAEPVEIVDQPEAYAKMREAAGLCSDCGGDRHAHMSNCPRLAAAVALMPLPQPTAYDRDQQALRDRLDTAFQRIEQLELEVARLKGPQSAYAQAIDQKLENIRQSASLILGDQLPRQQLACGCVGRCSGHQFSASPATAYPPLPDEGT